MNRIIFFIVFITVLIAADFYLFTALKTVTKSLSKSNQQLFGMVYWAIPIVCILLIISFLIIWPEAISTKAKTMVFSSIFIIYISKVLGTIPLLLDEILRAAKWIIQKINPTTETSSEASTISRSDFLTTTAAAVTAGNIGLMAYGIISGAHDYRVRRVKLRLKNLPKEFEGMTLAQVSDIHSGSFFNKTAVKGGVEMLMKEKPEMVFFTGDLVNDQASEFNEYFDIFKKIQAPLGVYSTLGNHDYGDYKQWASASAKKQNLETLMQAHKLMGWDLLMDENRAITVDNESIGVLGIQNWGEGFKQMGDLNKAMQKTEDFSTKLLLSHDPSHWRAQVLNKTNIDASFAGHTHGMQYGVEIAGIKFSPVQWRYKEWAGLYQENNQQLYVNRGYGYLGYPGRVGILPEITIFTLTKA